MGGGLESFDEHRLTGVPWEDAGGIFVGREGFIAERNQGVLFGVEAPD